MRKKPRSVGSKLKIVEYPDGSRRVGDGPGYLIFLLNGDVLLQMEGEEAFPEHHSLLQGFKRAYRDGQLDYRIRTFETVTIVQDLGEIQVQNHEIITHIEAIIDRCDKDEAKREIRKYLLPVLAEQAQRHQALQPVGEILDAESEEIAETKAKMLPKLLLPAYRLRHRYENRKPIEPYDTYRTTIARLAKRLDRPPTKGELGKEWEKEGKKVNSPDHVKIICRRLGFAWLRTSRPWSLKRGGQADAH